MRKVELTLKEEIKYKVIRKLVEAGRNKKRAACKVDCSVRSINRIIDGYRKSGKKEGELS